MNRAFALGFLLLSALTPAGAQDPPRNPVSASIEGTVVKDPGSQPLKKVLLEIVETDQKETNRYTASTDGDGRFRVENIAPGRYRLYFEKTGFRAITAQGHRLNSDTIMVAAGQQVKDLLFRMLPTAAITGRVVDEDGEPMAGVLVSLKRKGPGKSFMRQLTRERTDDHGEYRLAGLFPGHYILLAMPEVDARDYLNPSANSSQPEGAAANMRYPITYYPGTTDSTQATTVSLGPGDEMPLNFTLVPVKTYRVRGIVRGAQDGQKLTVQLFPKGMNESPLVAAEVSADGQFELRRVAPGSYVAVVESGFDSDAVTAIAHEDAVTATARENVTVVAGDVDGIQLVSPKPFTLTGRLRFDGQPADPTQYMLSLESVDHREDSPNFLGGGDVEVKPDHFGNFQWTMVNPGSYCVRALGGESGRSFVKSISIGTLKTDTSFTVSGPASIEVVLSLRGALVEGVVIDKDQPVANASVVMVPEVKYQKSGQHFGTDSTDQNGRFSIHGLRPGSYTIYAWQDLEQDSYYDPDFLKAQEGEGTSLKVEEGSRQRIELKLSPIGEEWR